MSYGISSRDYLSRAQHCLAEGSHVALFYAAFELRCGIEARLQEYLEVWDHISKRKKSGWRIVDLGRNVEAAFRLGNKIVRWAVHDRGSRKLVVCLYHTPVTQSLRSRGEKLGNYLHSLKRYRGPEDAWWAEFRTELCVAAKELHVANLGTLLGPPLTQKGTGQAHMNLELPPGSHPDQLMDMIGGGKELLINVEYLDSLPDPLEPQAITWPVGANKFLEPTCATHAAQE